MGDHPFFVIYKKTKKAVENSTAFPFYETKNYLFVWNRNDTKHARWVRVGVHHTCNEI